jgi:hypothetical protein
MMIRRRRWRDRGKGEEEEEEEGGKGRGGGKMNVYGDCMWEGIREKGRGKEKILRGEEDGSTLHIFI